MDKRDMRSNKWVRTSAKGMRADPSRMLNISVTGSTASLLLLSCEPAVVIAMTVAREPGAWRVVGMTTGDDRVTPPLHPVVTAVLKDEEDGGPVAEAAGSPAPPSTAAVAMVTALLLTDMAPPW